MPAASDVGTMSSVMADTSGGGPVWTPLLLLLPLEQAASATTGMAATRLYASFLMSRMGSPLHYLNEGNQPTRRNAASLPLITQILTSPNIDKFR
jgi:hypothetical protein